MRKRMLSILMVLCIVLALLPMPGLAAGITVTEIVPCKYDEIYPFSDGLARVAMKAGNYSYKYGFIDTTGREVIPCQYERCGDFSDGLAPMAIKVGEDKYGLSILKYGFIDKAGNKAVSFQYDSVGKFSEGLAPVGVKTGTDKNGSDILKWGFIDKAGNEVVPFKYNNAEAFSEGIAWVYIGDSDRVDTGKWGTIDTTGREIVPCIFDGEIFSADTPHSFPFSEGLAPVLSRNGYNGSNNMYGYTDKAGNLVIPAKYDRAFSFSEGLAVVVTDGYFGKVGAIDKTGREVIPCKYDWINNFSEGLASVELNGKHGFIDKTGREVIPCKYERAGSFSEGLAPVMLNGKWGFIDKTGETVATLKYNYSVGNISEGFSIVNMNGKRGLISVSGKNENISQITVNGKSIQSLFSKSSLEYDNDLALFAAQLSEAAEDKYGSRFMNYYLELGWPLADHRSYQYGGDRAFSIACAKLSKNENLLVITARGSQTKSEFFEDGLSFGHRDFFGYQTNDVIYDFEEDIIRGLHLFLMAHPYLMETDLKILITGHSLGGAAANLVAARFTLFEDSGAWWSDLAEQSDIYCYTFGAINSLSDNSTVKNGFENIHNIYNLQDSFGPNRCGNKLPSGLGRGYGKFGHMEMYSHNYETSLYIPFVNSTNHLIENYIDSLTKGYVSCKADSPFSIHGGGSWCPVDLKIYLDTQSGSVLVGSITDDQIDEIEHPMVGLRVDGDRKYFYLPDNGHYTIKLEGTNSGTMTYFVQDMDAETGEPIPGTGTVFQNVSLTQGKQFSSEVNVIQESTENIETQLYVLNADSELEKEVLPDGKGTEIPYEPKPVAFTDVLAGAYYYDAVRWAVEKGITAGTSATTFSPNASCTRAQTVTFLWRAAGSPAPESSTTPFTDVKPGAYYYNAVLWAVENGITSGTSATTFSPDATVTRAQTVTFLYRAANSPAVAGSNSFVDVPDDAYYTNAVQWAVSKEVTAGTSTTTFSPDAPCTRAQIVTFLYRDRAS